MTTAAIVALVVRYGLVLLFLPFSALDKIFGFDHAVKQAQSMFKPRPIAIAMILIGLFVEVVCTLGVVTGVADRACAFVIAGYCAATAVLYKQFWAQGDFWSDPDGKGRTLLWDFLKNLSLGAGFLLIVVGTDGIGARAFSRMPRSPPAIPTEFTHERSSRQGRPKPSVPYWHLYVDADGISHQSQCALTDYELKGVGPADPQWNDKMERGEATVVFTVQPVGWVGDWHENPAPQWIIVLSGRWWIESMDGARIEQGPGDFSFGEDQGCTETDGKKGHRSGTIGDEPCCLMTVQLHVDPKREPCHLT